MYTIENNCLFLTGDAIEVFICLKILCVVAASDAVPENMSSGGRKRFVRIKQANNTYVVRVTYSVEIGSFEALEYLQYDLMEKYFTSYQ